MFKFSLSLCVWVSAFLTGVIAQAEYGTIAIPLKTFIKPASNLVDNQGHPLSIAELQSLFAQGYDLSKLHPTTDNYWQNKKFSAEDLNVLKNMPSAESGVQFDTLVGATAEFGLYSLFVVDPQSHQRYSLTLGKSVHASLLKAAFLRKLGVYQLTPQFYSRLKVSFDSEEQKKQFVENIFCKQASEEVVDCLKDIEAFSSDATTYPYVTNLPGKDLYLNGIYLEKMDESVPSIFDGITNKSAGTVQFNLSSRSYRSLIVPFVIGNFGEDLDAVTTEALSVDNGVALISYEFASLFTDVDYFDVRWILRRIAQLTNEDWDQIVEAAHYPEGLRQMAKGLLMRRSMDFMTVFFDRKTDSEIFEKTALNQAPSVIYTSEDRLVVNGKIQQKKIEGYPQRLSYDDAVSPFEAKDIVRYMKLKLKSGVLKLGLQKLTEKLQKEKTSKTIQTIEVNSQGQFRAAGFADISQWGVLLSGDRFVTTGTYYGSDAALQLVDTVSFGVSYLKGRNFQTLSGLLKNAGGRLSYIRDYTHVQPLTAMKDATSVSYADIYIPGKLDKLTQAIDQGNLNDFFKNLKIGEVYTINDSISIAGGLGWNRSLESIVPLTATTIPTLAVGLQAQKSITFNQIQIIRTDRGLQIYRRYLDTASLSPYIDINYFLSLMSLKNDRSKSSIKTQAFFINNSSSEKEINTAYDKKALAALKMLVDKNSSLLLDKNFKSSSFDLDHKINTNETQARFLWFRNSRMNEEHSFSIQKPELINESGLPVQKNKPLEFSIARTGELTGVDYLGFATSVVDAYLKSKLKDKAPQFSQEVQNPSQMPFGQAHWHIVRTDAELTQQYPELLPQVALVQNVYGGWSLSNREFNEILHLMKNKLIGTEYEFTPLITDERFSQTEKIDFFKVTENLSLMPGAITRIQDLFVNPKAIAVEKPKYKFLSAFFQTLTQAGQNNQYDARDQAIYNNVMLTLGSGDYQKGHELYMNRCVENQKIKYQYTWLKGTAYECLEPWLKQVITTARDLQNSTGRKQNILLGQLVQVLNKNIPLGLLLEVVGKENFKYFIEVVGFRKGDKNGSLVYTSKTLGELAARSPYARGLTNVIVNMTNGLSPVEVDRSLLSAQ